MEKIAGTAELEPTEKALSAAEGAGKVQEATSFLPDYTFKDVDEESGAAIAGTTVSGIVGALFVAILCAGIALIARACRKAINKKKVNA